MALRVFIGTRPGMERCDRVLALSILEHASAPVEIVWMRRGEEGYTYDDYPLKTFTDFTTFRYGVPALLGPFEVAVYFDCDILCLGDVHQLAAYGVPYKWNTNSRGQASVSVIGGSFNIGPCRDVYRSVHPGKFETPPYTRNLPDQWHRRDTWTKGAQLIHFTSMKTQPWEPFPDIIDYLPHPCPEAAQAWLDAETRYGRA